MISQKEAVYQATIAVFEKNGVDFDDGDDARDAMRGQYHLRSQIRDLVFEGLNSGEVALSNERESSKDKRDNENAMRAYATGLVSNWLRKDKRLNGNTRYIPKQSREERFYGSSKGQEQQGRSSGDQTGHRGAVTDPEHDRRLKENRDRESDEGESPGLTKTVENIFRKKSKQANG